MYNFYSWVYVRAHINKHSIFLFVIFLYSSSFENRKITASVQEYIYKISKRKETTQKKKNMNNKTEKKKSVRSVQ